MNTGSRETSYSEQVMVLTVSGKENDPPGRSISWARGSPSVSLKLSSVDGLLGRSPAQTGLGDNNTLPVVAVR